MALSYGRLIALACFIFTAGTISLSYYLAIQQGHAPVCNPFIEGCTDITHTGMKGSAGMLFRAGMIIGCVFIAHWWFCMNIWLKPHASVVMRRLMLFFGILSVAGLIMGTAVIMTTHETSLWSLHIRGANLFFQASLLAFIFNYRLVYVRHKKHQKVPSFKLKTLLFILIMLVVIAFAALGIKEYMNKGEIVLEWWSTSLICLYYLSSFWDWKQLRLKFES